MPNLTIPQALELAVQHHQSGRLQEAERLYRLILGQQPRHPDALHLLGVIAHQIGFNEDAVNLIRQAIDLNPSDPSYHSNLGCALRSLKRDEEAIESYQRALTLNPMDSEVHSNLGNSLLAKGKTDEAICSYHRALELNPKNAEAHYNLGIALKDQNRFEEALACFDHALALKPDYAEALNSKGAVLQEQGLLKEAIALYQEALRLKLESADTHNNLGSALHSQAKQSKGKECKSLMEEAIAHYRHALKIDPEKTSAINNLGAALHEQGKSKDAIFCYESALALDPKFAETHLNLGNVQREQGLYDDALASFQRALELKPDCAEAHVSMGLTLQDKGKLDEAVACYQQAIFLKPKHPAAYLNLGNAFKDKGEMNAAISYYEQAFALKPESEDFFNNLIYILYYHSKKDSRAITEKLREWHRHHAEPLKEFILPHNNDRNPERKLRIGYVSPDMREHPVGRFLLPLIEHHDRGNFELYAYAQMVKPDAISERFRSHMDGWHLTLGLSDEQVADQIREDKIDILVDLAMHTANNRLLVFARKPAPVQVTWLAYCGSTGLETMDYRLSDPFMDPPGQNDSVYTEKTVYLETFWCYQPTGVEPEPNPLPSLEKGFVTFGCLNNFCKISDPTKECWAEILRSVPSSNLLIHATEGGHRQQFIRKMEQHGIDPQRIAFAGRSPIQEYFQVYHKVDIALDPFPYGGGTTTCDALWMGVPVISLVGKTGVGRGGLSLLSQIGLQEFAGKSMEEYVQIAASLANDLSRLAELRATLRHRMQASPLMDAPRFARNIETAYRDMWRKWCSEPGPEMENHAMKNL